MVVIRRAVDEDAAFLQQMLLLAADWRTDAPERPVAQVMSEPLLAHYVAGWPLHGDLGVVAEAGHPVGAAWWRFFREDDPGFGFVDAATPELSIGVRASWRGQSVGEQLLHTLISHARAEGVGALSLSVEPDNYAAVRLYTRLGSKWKRRPCGPLAHRRPDWATAFRKTNHVRLQCRCR